MATNNATNTSNPITVPQGGTGVSSTTAYAVLCGGTSSTNPIQSVASLGNSGDVLTSNGAGALPTFQASSSGLGYTISIQTRADAQPTNLETYFLCNNLLFSFQTSGAACTRMYIPHSGTVTKAYGRFTLTSAGTGSSENTTLSLRLNNTTDTNISTTIQFTTTQVPWSNTGLNIAVSAGDYLEFKMVCPTWSVNPGVMMFSGTIYIA